ncbi:MAG TPA: hypothetical protein VNU19_20155 [Candidatus Acidoferrum sp.]|jgi:hypothetical protein|nr:hypothetical protein [Candidatus Acidoferrum sp.]
MMEQPGAPDEAFFEALDHRSRKSQGSGPVRGEMRYVLLLILIGLLVFLSNQLWILFMGAPLF